MRVGIAESTPAERGEAAQLSWNPAEAVWLRMAAGNAAELRVRPIAVPGTSEPGAFFARFRMCWRTFLRRRFQLPLGSRPETVSSHNG